MTAPGFRAGLVRAVADTTPPGEHRPLRVAWTPRELTAVVDAVLRALTAAGVALEPCVLAGAREVDPDVVDLPNHPGRVAQLTVWDKQVPGVVIRPYETTHWVWDTP